MADGRWQMATLSERKIDTAETTPKWRRDHCYLPSDVANEERPGIGRALFVRYFITVILTTDLWPSTSRYVRYTPEAASLDVLR